MIRKEKIDAVISVVGSRALSILWKLSRKGLRTVCVPKSVENDVAATALSFGFNSALSFVAEMLERIARRPSPRGGSGSSKSWASTRAGWRCRRGSPCAPMPCSSRRSPTTSARSRRSCGRRRRRGERSDWWWWPKARGRWPVSNAAAQASDPRMKAALSPGATGDESSHVIERSGQVAAEVALGIQRLTDQETYPFVLGQLAKGGTPTVVDRQLGLGYGAGAVRALKQRSRAASWWCSSRRT